MFTVCLKDNTLQLHHLYRQNILQTVAGAQTVLWVLALLPMKVGGSLPLNFLFRGNLLGAPSDVGGGAGGLKKDVFSFQHFKKLFSAVFRKGGIRAFISQTTSNLHEYGQKLKVNLLLCCLSDLGLFRVT